MRDFGASFNLIEESEYPSVYLPFPFCFCEYWPLQLLVLWQMLMRLSPKTGLIFAGPGVPLGI
jgi:hypothetical protein